MKTLTQILDSFVERFKSSGEFDFIKFIHAGKSRPSENPVRNTIVACSVGKVYTAENDNKKTSRVQLEFSVYVPYNQGERELSSVADKLFACVMSSARETQVVSAEVGKAEYLQEFYALSRTLSVVVGIGTDGIDEENSDPGSDCAWVSVDSSDPVLVNKVEVISEHSAYAVSEYLAGETGREINHKAQYTMKITAPAGKLVLDTCRSFNLRITDEKNDRNFTLCRLCKVACGFGDGAVDNFTISAQYDCCDKEGLNG